MPSIYLVYKLSSIQAILSDAHLACNDIELLLCRSDMIIVIANSKGGVGKSTVAVHLAVWLQEQGRSVILADCDTQHSSSEWVKEASPEIRTERLGTPEDILDRLKELNKEADYVIADGPGSNSEISRALLLLADFAFVPCKASMLEVRALAQATKVLRQVQNIRNSKPFATIILSMVGKNYRLTKDMKEAAESLEMVLADSMLTQKQVYADAPGQRAVVWNLGPRGKQAGEEMKNLFTEILPFACRTPAANRQAFTETAAIPEIEQV
jgi:chromosome partitioning protein